MTHIGTLEPGSFSNAQDDYAAQCRDHGILVKLLTGQVAQTVTGAKVSKSLSAIGVGKVSLERVTVLWLR